jgi:hypothetical protein
MPFGGQSEGCIDWNGACRCIFSIDPPAECAEHAARAYAASAWTMWMACLSEGLVDTACESLTLNGWMTQRVY